jgi:T5SS/PEP-CTERM-associated repeat protein/autotransporter-associated beta strand protein
MDADWTVNDSLSIAYNTSAGETIVLDVGSWYLTVNYNLIVGHNRRGTLNLGTGSVSVLPKSNNVGTYIGNDSGSVGIVNVDGGTFTAGGEKPFYIGQTGTGTLNLNSGSVVSTNEVYIGNNAAGNGTVNVNGGTFTARKALYVGNSGTGTLNLNGGTLTARADLNVANGSGSTGTFNGTSGTLSLTGSGNVFNVGHGENSTGTVTKDGGDWSCYYLRLGNASGATGSFTHNGGTLEVNIGSKTDGFAIGNKASGMFTLNGGTVTVNNTTPTRLAHQSGASGTLNLNGGTLVTKQVEKGNGSTGNLNFNGGTLKANAADGNGIIKSGVTVNVDAGGGTIDSNNLGINVGAAIGGTGAMRFKGGNTILLNGANTYSGGTTIELGTKVTASNGDAMTAILGTKLTVDCSTYMADADGIEVFQYNAGGLTNDNVECINCGDGTVAKVSDDGKKILVDFKARPWATVSADTTWSALVAAAGGAPASDASVSVKMTGDYTLTIDADVTVGQIAFSNGDGATLVVNNGSTLTVNDITGISNIVNNGKLVKTGDGTVAWPFDRDSEGETVVSNGTLKVASKSGTGTSHTVRVKSGAYFDMNGVGDNVVHVILEEGAHFVNTGAYIGNQTLQAKSITLEGNATVTATPYAFGLRSANGEAQTTLALGSNTLTLDGTSAFWLVGTTITGSGVINVANGTLQCVRYGASGEDCTVSVGENGTFRIEAGLTLTVKNFVNGGHINTDGHGTLAVTGTFTPGSAAINKLTLASGATVKASSTTSQTVLETFSASGAYTIDASDITKAQLEEAEEQRIPVLTVPTENKGGTWTVSNPPVNGARAKWVNNGDGTSTLYIAKSTGLTVIIY